MNFIKLLKQINNVPFPVTIKHLVAFGDSGEALSGTLRSGKDWMVLRNEHPRYKIADTRAEWLDDLALDGVKDGQDVHLLERVDSFASLLSRENITTVYSIGSGGAVFEYFLKKQLPQVRVIVTECTQEGVDRLARVCTEVDGAELFDALDKTHWNRIAQVPNSIVFIYRNEREFTDNEWRTIFRYMHETKVDRVFLGLMYTLTVLGFTLRKWKNMKKRFAGNGISFAGYLRNFSAIESFWKRRYLVQEEIPFPTCRGIYLIRIKS